MVLTKIQWFSNARTRGFVLHTSQAEVGHFDTGILVTSFGVNFKASFLPK